MINPLAFQKRNSERVFSREDTTVSQHHNVIGQSVSLRNAVRHHHDARTSFLQAEQFPFDGLNVKPTQIGRAFIQQEQGWRK